jgi:multidrug efflux pump subunit AcrB
MAEAPQSHSLEFRFKERVSQIAIRAWRVVLAACLGILGLALLAWMSIPRLEDARIDSPGASVVLLYPGASPEDIEAQVIRTLEPELNGLEGLTSIDTTARPNTATFILKFQHGTNMDSTAEQIRGHILSKRADLPAEVRDPVVEKFTTAFVAQMVLAVAGFRSERLLTDAANRLRDELLALPGVSTVKLRGARSEAVRVTFDPVRLASHGLTTDVVVARLRQNSIRVPAGDIDAGNLVTMLEVEHEPRTAAAIARLPVGASRDERGQARTVLLDDVADVEDQPLTMHERFLHDSEPAVGVEVRFRDDANATKLGRLVRATARTFERRQPEGVHVRVAYDQPEWVAVNLRNFTESLLEGIALVMAVVTLGLGLRSAAVVAAAIPLSIGGALVGLFSFGFALEQVSIAGLIVALGLLVDDAVVVTESIQLLRDRGLSAWRAAILGTGRVFWANNVTTSVACASFLPFFFMGGDIGKFILGLPSAVVLALVTSVIIAQVVTPWLSLKVLRKHSSAPPIADATRFHVSLDAGDDAEHERNWLFRPLKVLYAHVSPVIVKRPWVVVAISVALLGASLGLFPRIGLQFFPKADKPLLFVRVELPRGTRTDVTAQAVSRVAKAIRQRAVVRETSAVIGGGYPPIFIGRGTPWASSDTGDILVRTAPGVASKDAARDIEQVLAGFAGMRTHVEELYTGPPVLHPIQIRVFGDDYESLRVYAEQLKASLRAQPGTTNVRDNLSETVPVSRVELDADRALRFGVTAAQAAGTLRWLYGEDKIWEFRSDRDTKQVVLRNASVSGEPLVDLEQARIPTALGNSIPLFSIAHVEQTQTYAELHRRNSRRVVEVTSDLVGNALASKIVSSMRTKLDHYDWKPGYGYTFAGQQEETENSFAKLGLAAVFALIVIAVLLLLLFNSFRLTLIIVCAVPFVLLGVLPGLAFTGNPFGFMAFLGTVALIGVYVNHKIYFVDRALELIRRGQTVSAAIQQAGTDRIRPVVLTALTAVLGLLPLTLKGGPLWSAFGWVNVFGLIASIPLSLVLLPALMAIVYRRPSSALTSRSG